MPYGDKAALQAFLRDFIAGMAGSYGEKIDCILLSGSAARGDFKAGESDIDMHIVLKNDCDVAEIEKKSSTLFWELNRRHGLKLVRSYARKHSSGFSFICGRPPISPKPIHVVGPSGWQLKLSPRLSPASILGIEPQLMRGRIRNGKVLFGRDILADRETLRAAEMRSRFTYDFWVTLLIQPFFMLMPERVLKRCAKGLVFTFYGRIKEMGAMAEGSGAPGLPQGEGGGLSMAAHALRLKRDFERESKKMGILQKFWFCIRTPACILGHSLEARRRTVAEPNGR